MTCYALVHQTVSITITYTQLNLCPGHSHSYYTHNRYVAMSVKSAHGMNLLHHFESKYIATSHSHFIVDDQHTMDWQARTLLFMMPRQVTGLACKASYTCTCNKVAYI